MTAMTKNRSLFFFPITAICLILSISLSVAETEKFLDFPASSLIDVDEGTFECWLKFAFEPLAMHKGYSGRGALFSIDYHDPAFPRDGMDFAIGTKFSGERTATGMMCLVRIGAIIEGGELKHPGLVGLGQTLKRNQWIHFAAVWKGCDDVQIYVNSEHRGGRTFHGSFCRPLNSGARLYFGNSPERPRASLLAIDEVRISSIARKPEAFSMHGGKPQLDPWTLMVLDFDTVEAAGDGIIPTYAADMSIEPQPIPAVYRLVEGKYGKGLAFTATEFAE